VELISLAVGVIGTLIAVWVAMVGRQLVRPKLSVSPGVFELPTGIPWALRRRHKQSHGIVVAVSARELEHVVLTLPIRLQNRGSLPINDVELVIEVAAGAIIEDQGIIGPVGERMGVLTGRRAPAPRSVARLGGLAQSRQSIGLIRPGQTLIAGEIFQLRAGALEMSGFSIDAARMTALKERYSTCAELKGALEVRISVWSSSTKPLSLSVAMIWLAAANAEEAFKILRRMAALSAAEGPIRPGLYFNPLRKRLAHDELLEVIAVSAKSVEDLVKTLSPDGMVQNPAEIISLRLPPWGLWGQAFDVTAKWPVKLLHEDARLHSEGRTGSDAGSSTPASASSPVDLAREI